MSSFRRHLAILSLLLLALALRIAGLAAQPVNADEAMHLHPRTAAEVLTFDLMFNPPLFRAATAAACAVQRSVVAARVVPVVAGTVSVLLLYLLGTRLVGTGPALLAAFLLAVHPWHIRHSQTVRCFALLAFLVLLAELATVRGGDGTSRPKREPSLLQAAMLGLALLTHYLAVAHQAAEGMRSLVAGRRRAALLHAVPIVVVAGCFLPFLLAGTERKVAGDVPFENGLPFLLSVARATFAPGGLSLAAALLLAGIGATCRSARPLLLPVTVWVGATLLAGLAIPIEVRYCLPALPFFLLLAAAGAGAWWNRASSRFGRHRIGAAIATALLVAGVVRPLPDYYRSPMDPAPALAIHPDLAHVEVDLRPLLPALVEASKSSVPIFVAVRGPFHFRLAAELNDGLYPDDARLSENHSLTILDAGRMRLLTAAPDSTALGTTEGPETPAAARNGGTQGACLLLREHRFACEPLPACTPVASSSNADLLDCPPTACCRFPCRTKDPQRTGMQRRPNAPAHVVAGPEVTP